MEQDKLNQVRDFADRAHGDQTRKYTHERYIVHPERVMNICRAHTSKQSILAAALLHDVLEDTKTTKEEVFDFLTGIMGYTSAQVTTRLVEELTDEYEKKKYPNWNRAKRKYMESERLAKVSAEAQTVKYADILDNTQEIVQQDPHFARKYLQECKIMLEKMTKGHTKLRYQALKLVDLNL